jgi:hypothetical protein
MCHRVAIIATPKRKMPSGSGTVVLGGRTQEAGGVNACATAYAKLKQRRNRRN